jgi:hypothetical protein
MLLELGFHNAELLSASGSIERVRLVHLNETATRTPFPTVPPGRPDQKPDLPLDAPMRTGAWF